MNKKVSRSLAALAIVFVALSIITFAVPFIHNFVFWISYVFAVISILVQIYVFKTAFSGADDIRSKFYGFPIARIGIVYLLAQLILSLIFMSTSTFVSAWIVIVVYVLVLCISALGFIAADVTRDEIVRQDIELKEDVSAMRNLQSKAMYITNQCDSEGYDAVKELSDSLKYSDPVSSVEVKNSENDLLNLLDEIQVAVLENDKDGATKLSRQAMNILAERNRLCKLNK